MPFSHLTRTIQLALKSVLLHKLRSGLTMLGIVFGVFSVIAMLAIGEGASAQAQKQVLELGATNIIVRSVKPPEDGESTGAASQVPRAALRPHPPRPIASSPRHSPPSSAIVPVRELDAGGPAPAEHAQLPHRRLYA